MAPSGMVKLAFVVLMCMVVTAPHAQAAVTCGTVLTNLQPCLGYLRSGGAVPMPCCNGVKSLNSAAKTTADRQTACNCLKSAAGQIGGINPGYALGLPKSCGVNIPYKISTSTDCAKYPLSLSQ